MKKRIIYTVSFLLCFITPALAYRDSLPEEYGHSAFGEAVGIGILVLTAICVTIGGIAFLWQKYPSAVKFFLIIGLLVGILVIMENV